MNTLRYRSQGEDVLLLEQILYGMGYMLKVSRYFGKDTDVAVRDFQRKNQLVVDGIVGVKTWSKLLAANPKVFEFNNKLLSEQDLIDFARNFSLELPLVKAVNEVESNGKGFLAEGRPRILFEGHVFWRELEKRGFQPKKLAVDAYGDVLYEKWTRKHYRGGIAEYERMEKAAKIADEPGVREAAYCSASWGAFQIMGFHFAKLGYSSVEEFVKRMNEHEREHLQAFGRFISSVSFSGRKLVEWLRDKNWDYFAHGYNGSGYRKNNYHLKLKSAYNKYSAENDAGL